jgi:hypothetical protein
MTTCPPLALLEPTPLRHLPLLLSVTHASYSPILFFRFLGHGIKKASCEAFLFKIDNDNLSTLSSVRANPASSPSAVAFGDSLVLLSHSLFHFLGRNIKKASCEAFLFELIMTTCPPLALLEPTPLRHLPQLLSVTHASYSPIRFICFLGHGIKKASCEAFLFKIDNDNLAASYSPI